MQTSDDKTSLFKLPYMNLSRYYVKSMVWKVVSIEKTTQKNKKSKTNDTCERKDTSSKKQKYGRQTFDFYLTCAHCRRDIYKFINDSIVNIPRRNSVKESHKHSNYFLVSIMISYI